MNVLAPVKQRAAAQEVVASHRDDDTGELFGITEL